MAKKGLKETEILDLFEGLCIEVLVPSIKLFRNNFKKSGELFKESDSTLARNLIGKIGVRITFGKGMDKILLGKDKK